MDSIPDIAKVVKNLKLDRLWPRRSLVRLVCQKNISIRWLLMTYCYTYRTFLNPHRRSFFYSGDGTTETHNWTKCREWETLEFSVLNEMSSTDPPLVPGMCTEEETVIVRVKGEGWMAQWNSIFQIQLDWSAYELTDIVATFFFIIYRSTDILSI